MMDAYLKLEREVGEWVGAEPARVVTCSSGTAALHLAQEALMVSAVAPTDRSGHVVAMSDYNMVACPRSTVLAGMRPLFTAWRRDDLLMDPQTNPHYFAAQTGRRIAGYMLTHVYGRVVPWERAVVPWERAVGYNPYFVIEDMAEAHGVPFDVRSDAACWSFYKNKVVAGQEGGCVVFRDADVADIARRIRCLGMSGADYRHLPRGHNYRMSDAHAELVSRSLAQVGGSIKRRRDMEQALDDACPKAWRMPERQSPWVYDFRIGDLSYRERRLIVEDVRTNDGFDVRCGFDPMTSQPEFAKHPVWNEHARDDASGVVILHLSSEPRSEEYNAAHADKFFDRVHDALGRVVALRSLPRI